MASIAEEVAANARAQADGYASAAAKEAHANTRSQSAGYESAAQQEIDANVRAQAAGFRNAAEQEMDANRRAIFAGYENAALQEMDANRRAQAAGWESAAAQENAMSAFTPRPLPMGLLQMSGLINTAQTQPSPSPYNQFNTGMASNFQSPLNLPQNQTNFGFNPQNWSWGQSPFNFSTGWLFGGMA